MLQTVSYAPHLTFIKGQRIIIVMAKNLTTAGCRSMLFSTLARMMRVHISYSNTKWAIKIRVNHYQIRRHLLDLTSTITSPELSMNMINKKMLTQARSIQRSYVIGLRWITSRSIKMNQIKSHVSKSYRMKKWWNTCVRESSFRPTVPLQNRILLSP